jgi:hypothetical protein
MDAILGGLIILVGFGSAVAYLPLQLYTLIRLQGMWRTVALVPILLMLPVFVVTANAYASESNLWPILLIFALPIATGYLVAVLIFSRKYS